MRIFRRAFASALLAGLLLVPAAAGAEPASPFRQRVIKIGGALDDPAVGEHLAFARGQGFNTIWIPCRLLGAADCIRLDPRELPSETLQSLARLRTAGWSFALASTPEATELDADKRRDESRTERRRRRQLVAGWRSLGVSAWVLSSSDAAALQPYLRRRIVRGQRDPFFWIHTGPRSGVLDSLQPYSDRPRTFGWIVTVGPDVSMDSALHLAAAELRNRPLWLEELYPGLRDPFGTATALNLGPLQDRSTLPNTMRGYLASPMVPYLAGSRLSLMTVGDYLRDPSGYEPQVSWDAARRTLAGKSATARTALETQSVEWGGWFDTLNFRRYTDNRPESALATLRDPAAFASYGWTVKRYAERMEALRELKDAPFRDDLLKIMARRLAIARALPVVRAIRDPRYRSDLGPTELLEELARQRSDLADQPDALRVLEHFLELAAIQAAPPPTEGDSVSPGVLEPR